MTEEQAQESHPVHVSGYSLGRTDLHMYVCVYMSNMSDHERRIKFFLFRGS